MILGCDLDGVLGELVNATHIGSSYRSSLNWMRRPYAIETTWWQEKQWQAERRFAYHGLLEWEAAFVARFRKLGIPVHCDRFVMPPSVLAGMTENMINRMHPYVLGYACDMVHSTLKDMPPICWDIFRHVGEEIAESQGLDLTWGGDYRPWSWRCTLWEEWRWAPPPSQDFQVQLKRLVSTVAPSDP